MECLQAYARGSFACSSRNIERNHNDIISSFFSFWLGTGLGVGDGIGDGVWGGTDCSMRTARSTNSSINLWKNHLILSCVGRCRQVLWFSAFPDMHLPFSDSFSAFQKQTFGIFHHREGRVIFVFFLHDFLRMSRWSIQYNQEHFFVFTLLCFTKTVRFWDLVLIVVTVVGYIL